jgi:hypothetical protein
MNNNYIISLTTIPSKFENLHITIDSILNQTILPNKIIINIPERYNFRMNNSEITIEKMNEFKEKYSRNEIIQINRIEEDYGPGTKLLGILTSEIMKNIEISRTYIILIDDDVIYKPYMIEYFDKYIKEYKKEVCSFYVYNSGDIQIGQGVDGFLIKLNLLDEFLKFYRIIKDNDYIKYHDDFYISYYFYLKEIEIEYIKPPNNCLIYETHYKTFIDALSGINGKYSRSNLNRKLKEILDEHNNKGCFVGLKNKIKN